MYATILVTLDLSPTDRGILEHVKKLAKHLGSRVVALHVVDGWAARRFGAEAVSEEIHNDTAYMETIRQELEQEGINVACELAYGEPAEEIVKWVRQNPCDLVAMGTHGHKGLVDFVLGWTASRVQHELDVPVLMLRSG